MSRNVKNKSIGTATVEVRPVMTIQEAHDVSGLHERTIARHCNSGKIQAAHIGGRWLINREAFMNQILGNPAA